MAPVQSAQSGDFSNGAELGTPTARLDRFLSEVHPPTPFIVLDLDIVRARYAASRQALPAATIYYALKANPATELIAALAALGASFISPAPANSTFETKRRQGADPAASRQRRTKTLGEAPPPDRLTTPKLDNVTARSGATTSDSSASRFVVSKIVELV